MVVESKGFANVQGLHGGEAHGIHKAEFLISIAAQNRLPHELQPLI